MCGRLFHITLVLFFLRPSGFGAKIHSTRTAQLNGKDGWGW
jgi:hypothetical protein